jgi:hypothetical protein
LRPSGSSILVALWAALGLAAALRAQTASPARSEATATPQMISALNQSSGHTPDAEEGLIKLDVVVTDESGKPVPSLGRTDLTLLDNLQLSKILSFHAFDGTSATSDLPVEVILVIDTLRMPGLLASHEREEVEKFLGRNGGHLSRPVSIFKLLDSGLWLVAEPSRDGKALAEQIAHDGQLRSIRKAVGPAGGLGRVGRCIGVLGSFRSGDSWRCGAGRQCAAKHDLAGRRISERDDSEAAKFLCYAYHSSL